MKTASLACISFLFLISHLAGEVPHLISYQGRLSSNAQPFFGIGHFKFALVGSGEAFYWRNDGASGPGEPAVSVGVPVTNGLFTVVLGDTSLPGMAALSAAIFANPELYLRIWFDDG